MFIEKKQSLAVTTIYHAVLTSPDAI